MLDILKKKDWTSLFRLIMEASNALHSICHYTYPPIFYLNEKSKEIIDEVHNINENAGKEICAYTFDAGPNAVIFTTEDQVDNVISSLTSLVGEENIFVTKPGKGPQLTDEHLF